MKTFIVAFALALCCYAAEEVNFQGSVSSAELAPHTENILRTDHKCTDSQRLETGFQRKGTVIRESRGSSASECVSNCVFAVQGCVAMNYNYDSCTYLSSVDYVYASNGYTTALVNPSDKELCYSGNMILGYTRDGGDMPGMPKVTKNAKDCCILCYSTPNCIAFAFVMQKRTCYLKRSLPPLIPRNFRASGLMCPRLQDYLTRIAK